MDTVISKSCSWIRNHFFFVLVNKYSIVVIIIYYYVGLLSFITVPLTPIYHLFTSGSSVAVVVRALMTAMVTLYSLLVVIVNKEKVQWIWAVVFTYILLFTLLSTALSPQTYSYVYVTSLYRIVHKTVVAPGFTRMAVMFLSSVSDFVLSFCFLFILPLVINRKKQLLVLLVPIALIGFLECVYSIVFEKEKYIDILKMLGGSYAGYEVSVGATFGNKQDWGAFANVAFVASLFSFVLLDSKKRCHSLYRFLLLINGLILFLFTIMSLCKTAIISEIIMIIFFIVFLIQKCWKNSRFLFWLFMILVTFITLFFFAFLFIPEIHSLPYLDKVYTLLDNYFIQRISWDTLWGRTSIWYRTISNLRLYNLFFGLSKGGVSAYSKVIIIEGQSSIHNGLAYFLLSYGIMGFSIYLLLLFIVIKRIALLFCVNKEISFCSLGVLFCSLIFTIVESEVFIVSGSNPIFVFNIILCSFVYGYYRKVSSNAS